MVNLSYQFQGEKRSKEKRVTWLLEWVREWWLRWVVGREASAAGDVWAKGAARGGGR
jgi:hypothetical protein